MWTSWPTTPLNPFGASTCRIPLRVLLGFPYGGTRSILQCCLSTVGAVTVRIMRSQADPGCTSGMRCHTLDCVPGNPAAHYERLNSPPLGVESTAHLPASRSFCTSHTRSTPPDLLQNAITHCSPPKLIPLPRVSILLKLHLLDCTPLSSIRFTLLTFVALRSRHSLFFSLHHHAGLCQLTARSFSSPVLLRQSLRNSPSKHTGPISAARRASSFLFLLAASSRSQEAQSLRRTYHPCETNTRRRCTRTNVSLAKLSPPVLIPLRIAEAA